MRACLPSPPSLPHLQAPTLCSSTHWRARERWRRCAACPGPTRYGAGAATWLKGAGAAGVWVARGRGGDDARATSMAGAWVALRRAGCPHPALPACRHRSRPHLGSVLPLPLLAQMASMLEGGGKTPILSPGQLQAMGFKLCAYPLSLLGVSVRAMEDALAGLKRGAVPQPPAMPTFQARVVGGRGGGNRGGVCVCGWVGGWVGGWVVWVAPPAPPPPRPAPAPAPPPPPPPPRRARPQRGEAAHACSACPQAGRHDTHDHPLEPPLPACFPRPFHVLQELQASVGFPGYYTEEERYKVGAVGGATSSSGSSRSDGGGGGGGGGGNGRAPSAAAAAVAAAAAAAAAAAVPAGAAPDAVLETGARGGAASAPATTGTHDLYSPTEGEGYGARDPADRRAQWLRVRVTDTKAGKVTLDTRFPAGEAAAGAGVAVVLPAVCCAALRRCGGASLPALVGCTACKVTLNTRLPASERPEAGAVGCFAVLGTVLLLTIAGAAAASRAEHALNARLPLRPAAGFLNSVATFVPAVAGVDLEGLVKQVGAQHRQSRGRGGQEGGGGVLGPPSVRAAASAGASSGSVLLATARSLRPLPFDFLNPLPLPAAPLPRPRAMPSGSPASRCTATRPAPTASKYSWSSTEPGL